MAMNTLETGPKLNWTRDNQMYERYRIWKKKVEFIFCSALADSTPKQLVSYLKYWMGDQGIPLIEKWESTGKLDYSNAKETPATEGGRRRALSSGYKVQTYWDLLDEEFKPKGNKLLSIIELWTRSKQGDKSLNQWLTQIYNLVNICKYPEDSTDRIIRDVLIVGCNSNHARDKIIRQGEAVTLNEVIEILQTEHRLILQCNRSRAMTRSLQVPYTIRHTIVEVRNPRILLMNRTPVTPVAPETFQAFQSFMTFQPFQAILQILQCSSISRESTPFQHSPIRMHILQFDWFPQKLHRVPVEQLQTLQTFILQRKGDVAISVKLTYSPE